MPTSSVPLDIKSFLTAYFDSVTKLEVLLKFFSNPSVTWTPDSLSREMRSHPASASRVMNELTQQGFITRIDDKQFVYDSNSVHRTMVETLYKLYQEKPVAIIACIYEKPNDKLKGFADAFKIKKD